MGKNKAILQLRIENGQLREKIAMLENKMSAWTVPNVPAEADLGQLVHELINAEKTLFEQALKRASKQLKEATNAKNRN